SVIRVICVIFVHSYKNPRSCSLRFYRAVRDLKPVWMLEDMRTMETFYSEEDARQRNFTPSEALLYAIVHDHREYARFLLSRHTEEALARPGERVCCCPPSHLTTAVRYDRRYILGLILQESHRMPSSLQHEPGQVSPGGGRQDPLHLACELLRPEAVVLLLGNGASPARAGPDRLDPAGRRRRQCLDNLLMFMPKVHFKLKAALGREPGRWGKVLGEETYEYLAGRSPAPLFLCAMQTVLQQLSPATFPDSLHGLPIPSSLKPRLV
uniref:Zgc:112001 n=1 Tax=Scophthalmus maximus TaxID=52904 RepID=A0A8D3BJY0_SCOMX